MEVLEPQVVQVLRLVVAMVVVEPHPLLQDQRQDMLEVAVVEVKVPVAPLAQVEEEKVVLLLQQQELLTPVVVVVVGAAVLAVVPPVALA